MARLDGVAIYDIPEVHQVASNAASSEVGPFNDETKALLIHSSSDAWCQFQAATGETLVAGAAAGKFFVQGGVPLPIRRSGNYLLTIAHTTGGRVVVQELA